MSNSSLPQPQPSEQAWKNWFKSPETQALLHELRTKQKDLLALAMTQACKGENASPTLLRAKALEDFITTVTSKSQ